MIAALLHILYMDRAQNKNNQVKLLIIISFCFQVMLLWLVLMVLEAFLIFFFLFVSVSFSQLLLVAVTKKRGSKMLVTDIQRGWLHQRQLDCSKQTKRTPVVSGNKCALGGPDHPHSQPDRISLLFSFSLKSLKCFPI